MKSPLSPKTDLGFSLVEVAFALGILSFSLVTILTLVPVALQGSRAAIDKGLELEMVQSTRARLLSLPYSALPDSGTLYFTEQGLETDAVAASRYTMEYTTGTGTVLPGGQSLARLRTVRLTLRDRVTQQTGMANLHLPDNGL